MIWPRRRHRSRSKPCNALARSTRLRRVFAARPRPSDWPCVRLRASRWSVHCGSGSTPKPPARGPTAEAIRYALNHWDGLGRFLEDGRIEIDSNGIERAKRPVSLSRKNSLFAGSDEGGENWACLASLIETCKLNGVNPQAYFTDLLTRLVNGWPQNRIDELMPWHWAPK